jgi:hypothetical protein
MEINIKNDKQELKYNCNQYYNKDIGYRLDVDNDRVYIYKDEIINVKDLKNGASYSLDEKFDELYHLTFIGEYINLLYCNDKIECNKEIVDGNEYYTFKLDILGNNRNLYKGNLYVDCNSLIPKQLIITNIKNEEKIKVYYSEFRSNENIDKNLFVLQ